MREEAHAAVETAKGVLQDIVVVVSLVRTLTDSFGSASDLYRKLKRKNKSDHGSGDERDRKERHSRRPPLGRRDSTIERGHDRHHHHSKHLHVNFGETEYSDSEDELIYGSSSQVRAEYDRGYRKLGEVYARGDLMTQNQLQSQIIHLQQTLLSIHQDYMMSAYLSPTSSHSHLVRLIQATRTARASSIAALNMQYQRMLPSNPHPLPTLPGAFPDHDIDHHLERRLERKRSRSRRRDSSASSSSSDLVASKPKPKPSPSRAPSKLFCVFARDLQGHARLPLTDNYKVGGNNLCPFCHAHTALRPGKAWEIVADGNEKHGRKRSRAFLVKNRFVVKCHREGGGFACVLCARFKESDTACHDINALMDHLWKDHTGGELEQDDDIEEC